MFDNRLSIISITFLLDLLQNVTIQNTKLVRLIILFILHIINFNSNMRSTNVIKWNEGYKTKVAGYRNKTSRCILNSKNIIDKNEL